jgi:hypothetical protein
VLPLYRSLNFLLIPLFFGGGERVRTDDLLRARQALSQLSYTPQKMVGLVGIEPTTSRLSGVRSNRD